MGTEDSLEGGNNQAKLYLKTHKMRRQLPLNQHQLSQIQASSCWDKSLLAMFSLSTNLILLNVQLLKDVPATLPSKLCCNALHFIATAAPTGAKFSSSKHFLSVMFE